MTAAIVIISLALYWLGYESRWLTIRLLVGCDAVIIEYARKPWEELEPRGKISLKNYPFWLCFPEHMHPLCGREWLENTMHVVPEYNIYMAIGGCRYNMTVKQEGILKQVMKANKLTKKQKAAYA